MPKNVERTTEAPGSKLGLIAEAMIETFENVTPDGVKLAVMLSDEEERVSLIALSGYPNEGEAAADLFSHLAAIFEANGTKLMLMPIGKG